MLNIDANCTPSIADNFIRNCHHKPKAGVLKKWIGKVEDIDWEASSFSINQTDGKYEIDQLVLKTSGNIYRLEGNDKVHKMKHAFSENDFDEGYIHTDTITFIDRNSTIKANIATMKGGRFFTIAEMVDGAGDGKSKFQVAGLFSGMKLINDDYDSGENSGTQTIVLETKEQELEPFGIANLLLDDGTTTETTQQKLEYTRNELRNMEYTV